MCASLVSQDVYHVTNLFSDAWRSFGEAIACGCQCCLLCLRRGEVLPAGFSIGSNLHNHFGMTLADDGNNADSGGEYDDDEDDEDETSSSSSESEDEGYSSDD